MQPVAARATGVDTAGQWLTLDEGLGFRPRFPPLPGTTYAVLVHHSLVPAAEPEPEFVAFLLPVPTGSAAPPGDRSRLVTIQAWGSPTFSSPPAVTSA